MLIFRPYGSRKLINKAQMHPRPMYQGKYYDRGSLRTKQWSETKEPNE